jgi:hypothetical protein
MAPDQSVELGLHREVGSDQHVLRDFSGYHALENLRRRRKKFKQKESTEKHNGMQ